MNMMMHLANTFWRDINMDKWTYGILILELYNFNFANKRQKS